MATLPDFASFYRAVNEREPFPWQRRLAEMVVSESWPDEIGVPTGLGKTGCIDIAVWALAMQASTLSPSERTLPTRTWYVVNRRLLVDAAWDHGQRISSLLSDATRARTTANDALRVVAEALVGSGALGTEHGPLHVTRLRGGVGRVDGTAESAVRVPDPSQPALVFSTVPMFASRWLFRGYGSSTSMRPIDGALAGIDTLVLLDEAHLARPLARLAEQVAQCDIGDPTRVLPVRRARPTFVEMTATGEHHSHRFDLDEDDRNHPIVKQRLEATKPVTLVETIERKLAETLAENALALLERDETPAACVVFANTPKRARAAWDIAQAAHDLDVVLLTGRSREWEAAALRDRVLDPDRGAPATREHTAARARKLLVVATQTLEVGADLDFDYLVTETAGVRALIQRFGRLNRLGSNDRAQGVICHASDAKYRPVYGDEIDTVWETLRKRDTVDLGPAHCTEILGEPHDEPPRTGELLPEHVWDWAKTSVPPIGEAPPELFFDGFDESTAEITVAWRAFVPDRDIRLHPELRRNETIDIPIGELRDILTDRDINDIARIGADQVTIEHVTVAALRPGDQVVLAASTGLYDEFGWNPIVTRPVLDVSPFESGTLVLHHEVIHNLLVDSPERTQANTLLAQLDQPADDWDDPDPNQERQCLTGLIACLRRAPTSAGISTTVWTAFLERLSNTVIRTADGAPIVPARPPSGRAHVGVRADAFDELSFVATSAILTEHLGSVGTSAAHIATQIGCPDNLVQIAQHAGAFHDFGKADPRFQRWLDPETTATTLLAKSGLPRHRIEPARVASGWPRGGRHEAISVRLVETWLADNPTDPAADALLMHLVASHHGHGRPSLPAVNDPAPQPVTVDIQGATICTTGDLSVPDWTQPARFRALCEEYGYWGLALLEAIVRQADQAVSSVVEVL